ncbi:enoyl-CoA hydratase [Reticulibacter mediterranei]|uniref:Enoyl-CoA hydratase n=1 Tax=Reticulibacter mediterranei TaxID=2778369 RepID=A0A8J3IHK0_9CHLR|nr:3-hydroxyacyl-CoA dehydrogenase/enoyl-CoA hydratase family protein [Reticulibacter mediterranei]GHO92540.1 enoyl-CoA hydratase [Reticulibacter mediterranei]
MPETTSYAVRKVAVLGAGVMGAAIAAHLANVGIPSYLLDIVPPGDTKDRDIIARTGLEKALKAKPASFYSKRAAKLVTIGNIEDDLEVLADVDWIIEAVVERLDIKHALYGKIEMVLTPGTIISSNTSGLPAHMLVEGRSEDFRRHFLITHFFNPVRYMRLLEIVPNHATDPALVQFMQHFATNVLGKGVVLCKDTPNFIANRIGVYGFMSTFQRVLTEGYRVAEVDAILGPVMGRPKSAVFRTADLSGLDTLVNVSDNLYNNAPEDDQRETFKVPEVIREMLKRGMLGEKSSQGFYKRIKSPDGESTILELDLSTLEYVPQQKVRYPSIGNARNYDDPGRRMLTMLEGDDRASQLARETTADALLYAANHAEEIADSIVAVDDAMRWGFNFDLGSFEVWDLLLQNPTVLEKVLQDRPLPELVQRVQSKGQGTFYTGGAGQHSYFDFTTDTYKPVPRPEGCISLAALKAENKVVRDNGSAALIDLGDGVGCIEFHTKMNSIDEGIIEMMYYAVNEGQKQFRALVIGSEAADFSAGANLLLVLMGARQGEWQMLEKAINGLQQANLLLKYSPIPIVAALAGRALGGGCEIVMHGHHTRAFAESYMGQVEGAMGLIPAGGGCKELLLRYGADLETQLAKKTGGPFTPVRKAFETIAFATVSTSAVEAQELRFLRKTDAITINRDLLFRDAKADAIKLAEARATGNWQPPKPQQLLLPGAGARLVLEQQVEGFLLTGKISEHDAIVGRHLARVLTGGDCSPITPLTEQQVLDLEREAFLSLCGTEKTQERIQSFLMTSKPLRN